MKTKKEAISTLDEFNLQTLTENKKAENIKVIPTGSFLLDKALSVGGWPEGKIIELFGNDSSGKTTLALQAIAEAQKLDKVCVYLDLENTLNPLWAKQLNVKTENLYVGSPDNGESAFETINNLIKSGKVDLIVIDSVAAMVPKFEFENNIEEQTMGLHARLMSKGMRILQSNMIGTNTTLIFINQVREKIGTSFIPMTVTTGGRALRYAASVRVEVKRIESIKQQEEIVGFITKAIVIKNKFGAPMHNALLHLMFKTGFDQIKEIISVALNHDIIKKNGSWFSYEGQNVAQGQAGLYEYMVKNPEVYEKIKGLCLPLI